MDGQARLRRTDDPKGIYSLQTEQERIERKNIEICTPRFLMSVLHTIQKLHTNPIQRIPNSMAVPNFN